MNPDWEDAGLPDACPECGEDTKLAAHIDHLEKDAGPISGEVFCRVCWHSWEWTADNEEADA